MRVNDRSDRMAPRGSFKRRWRRRLRVAGAGYSQMLMGRERGGRRVGAKNVLSAAASKWKGSWHGLGEKCKS